MKTFLQQLRISILATVGLAVLVSGVYPVVIWAIAQVAFPHQANGSLVQVNGQVVGSELLGQGFSGAKYFHPRPSAAGTGYDPTSSGGTNLGPTSQKLMDSIKAAVAAYRQENNLAADALVPADAVTSSGSGLDPHISPENAKLQVPRVAKERNLPLEAVNAAVEKATERPAFGFLGGETGVNVLKLNLSLDGSGK
ncbi:MAG TPA: K(+)-transporting ATPase subunit C [Chthoniobacterales bacterium]